MVGRGTTDRQEAKIKRQRYFGLAAALLLVAAAAAQAAPPKLAVVVSIDQFPREYLDRFAALFPADGFRRLLDEGADFPHCMHEHFQTVTGAGHAVMLTGAYPVHNGVVGNWWHSRTRGGLVGCVEDERFRLLESPPDATAAGVSPLALQSGTVGDVLRTATRARAKVVSVAIKDRGAVLLAGQRPTGAYWYDPHSCHFVTSTYYAARLPDWVERFNASEPCAPYVGRQWTKLRSDVDYTRFADDDDAPYEKPPFGLGRTFPHPVNEIINPAADGAAREQFRYAAVASSPFGNELLLRFTEAAVAGEELGSDDVSDLLTVSFSSNDYVGHGYGPHSQEALDMTLRTDRLLAELLRLLDRRIGRGRWVLALTSDHGVAPIPEYLERLGLLAARPDHHKFDPVAARGAVERKLAQRFFGRPEAPANFPGFFEAWERHTWPFVYVNHGAVDHLPGRPVFDALLDIIAGEIESLDGVARVYRRSQRAALAASHDRFEQRAARGWHDANGGDLLVQLEPYWIDDPSPSATTHGMPYAYDAQVPMLLYGAGIRAGRFHRPVAVVDLAPTLAHLLGIPPPPQNDGEPLAEALR